MSLNSGVLGSLGARERWARSPSGCAATGFFESFRQYRVWGLGLRAYSRA